MTRGAQVPALPSQPEPPGSEHLEHLEWKAQHACATTRCATITGKETQKKLQKKLQRRNPKGGKHFVENSQAVDITTGSSSHAGSRPDPDGRPGQRHRLLQLDQRRVSGIAHYCGRDRHPGHHHDPGRCRRRRKLLGAAEPAGYSQRLCALPRHCFDTGCRRRTDLHQPEVSKNRVGQ